MREISRFLCKPWVACHTGIGKGVQEIDQFIFFPVADGNAFCQYAIQRGLCGNDTATVVINNSAQ